MKFMFGCATVVSAIVFVLAYCAMFGPLDDLTLSEELFGSLLIASIFFTAIIVVAILDRFRFGLALRTVRRRLSRRRDVNDEEFSDAFPTIDRQLLLEVRNRCAEFLGVAPTKIHPTDDIRKHLNFEAFEPAFHSFVIYSIFESRAIIPDRIFAVATQNFKSIGDFAIEVGNVLEFLKSSHPDVDQN